MFPPVEEIGIAVSNTAKKEDHDFASAFRNLHKQSETQGWDLLAQLFDFQFSPNNSTEPFSPMAIMDGKRSMIPADLSDANLDQLQTLLKVDDPEFRARIADVLWLRRRNPNSARQAVEAYLQSGIRLEDPKHWVPSMKRYERAVRLARQLDAKGELPKQILTHLEKRVRHYAGADPSYFSLNALELLEEFNFGDHAALAGIASNIAQQSRISGDHRKARLHFNVQARLLKRAKMTEEAETAQIALAESFVEEAEAQEKRSFMVARKFWQDAIRAFRDRPALRSRIPELQKRLSVAGQKTLEEMKRHSIKLDLSEEAKSAQNAIANRSKDDAFFSFVFLVDLIDPDALRADAEKTIREHPLQALIDAEIFDAAGRKIGVRPSAMTDDPAQMEAAIVGFMEQHARFHRGPVVHGYLEPAMHQLLAEHEIDDQLIENLLGDSPLISDDRKSLFVQAFVAAFQWDFSTALHILIPQVENSLRLLLAQEGITPSNVDVEGVEEVWSYERILNQEILTNTIGPKMAYELKSLLVERIGPNMRNLLAHGLLAKDALNSETGFYLLWIVLRLVALPSPKARDYLERMRNSRLASETK